MKRHYLLIAVSLLLSQTVSAAKGLDLNYLRKCAETVWSMELPQFDPKAPLDSSLYENVSAVFIASYTKVNATRDEVSDIGRFTTTIGTIVAKNNVRVISRNMVKLNDAKAIDDFSDFRFLPDEYLSLRAGLLAYDYKYAFGARIHKPDGRIMDVDMSSTLTETEGKKGKTVTYHKIAIPGLEVGDVLDYFYLTDRYMLANQSVGFDVEVFRKYPVRNFLLSMTLNSRLTTEINSFNELPQCEFSGFDSEGRANCGLELQHLQAFEKSQWCKPKRQVPYMRVKISDNVSNLFKTLKSVRRCGVLINNGALPVLYEIAEVISDLEVPSKDASAVMSLVKNYRKLNPEASEEQIADAAWLATLYIAFVSKENFDSWLIAAMYKDTMDKLQLSLPVTMAVATSRDEIPLDQIASYKQVSPLVMVGDRPFLHSAIMSFQPGEIPGGYSGEPAYTLGGKRSEVYAKKDFGHITLPLSNAKANARMIESTVTIPDVSGSQLAIDYTSTIRGFYKAIGELMVTPDHFLLKVEGYLAIPEKDRSKRKMDVAANALLRDEILSEMPKLDFNIKECVLDSASVVSVGFLPDESSLSYKATCSAEGLVSPAGDDLIVSLPALAMRPADVRDEKREREISIMTAGPSNVTAQIRFQIPEGYTVNSADLEHLQVNVSNLCGMFYAQTALDQDGNIIMKVVQRNNKTIYHPDRWTDFLTLQEAADAFVSSSLVLHRD